MHLHSSADYSPACGFYDTQRGCPEIEELAHFAIHWEFHDWMMGLGHGDVTRVM